MLKEEHGQYVVLPDPKREWLVWCTDANLAIGVCGIDVGNGELVVSAPAGSTLFRLGPTEVAEFRAALDEAIAVVESDLCAG